MRGRRGNYAVGDSPFTFCMPGSNKEENYHITEIPVLADTLSDSITKNVKMHAPFYQENTQQLFIKPLHFSVFYGHGT